MSKSIDPTGVFRALERLKQHEDWYLEPGQFCLIWPSDQGHISISTAESLIKALKEERDLLHGPDDIEEWLADQ